MGFKLDKELKKIYYLIMTIREIVEKYLKENKYEGLFLEDWEEGETFIECYCSLKDGIMPCEGERENPTFECRAGHSKDVIRNF